MNVKLLAEKKIASDTVKMTLLSLAMQTAAMVFNVSLSKKAGSAAVGLMSLVFTLFGFIMVLANGNILTSTGRFISEARGAGHENFSRIMKYSLTFSACLSTGFGLAAFFAADIADVRLSGGGHLSLAVKLIALSLPFASAGSCIKGYFHGVRRVEIPMCGDLIEFAVKWSVLFGGLILFGGTRIFYIVTAASILAGEFASFLYYLKKYRIEYAAFSRLPQGTAPLLTDTPSSYLKNAFPILLSGYVQMLMSTANELLVPAALLRHSLSADEALASYGLFEAIIIPAIFFPSAVLSSLSGVIVPEAALANRISGGGVRSRRLHDLTDKTFRYAFTYSFFIAAVFFCCADTAGRILAPSSAEQVGRSLAILAPVIPFIYLEILLEGLLKGMGRQNFSTVNSLCEYAVRIACVMIFVGKIGFDGVLISYYASNVLSNIARIVVVCRESGIRFSFLRYAFIPLAKGAVCCAAGRSAQLLTHSEHSGDIASLAVFLLAACTAFAFLFAAKRGDSSDHFTLKKARQP